MLRLATRSARVGQSSSSRISLTSGTIATNSRGLAVPVNKRSSVDPLLGISPPAPPRAAEENDDKHKRGGRDEERALPNFLAGTSRPNNPNDLSELLRGHKVSGFPRNGQNSNAQIRSRTAAAIGAMRRGAGSTIPTQDLEDAFMPPDAPEAVSSELHSSSSSSRDSVEVTVNPTPVDREHPHPIDAIYGRNDLDERILAAARALHHARTRGDAQLGHASTISNLLEQFNSRSERTLSIELPNESRPKDGRRVPLTSAISSEAELEENLEDGVLLIAYITGIEGGRGQERISVCSGFAVEGGERLAEDEGRGRGALVVSCAHTLRGSIPTKPKGTTAEVSDDDSSIALAITRSGHIFPITSLLSSLPTSDLLLLQLGEQAFAVHEENTLGAPLTASPVQVRTLPLNPYPAQVGAELCVSSFWGWEDDAGSTLPAFEFQASAGGSGSSGATGGSDNGMHLQQFSPSLTLSSSAIAPPVGREKEVVKQERDDAGRSRWGRARLVEYRDISGREALPGTYDDLAQLDFKLLLDSTHNPPALQPKAQSAGTGAPSFPPPGSSGGPIVDAVTGSVVGVTRGTKMSQLGGSRGDGIPAEKIFFFFALPGFPKKSSS